MENSPALDAQDRFELVPIELIDEPANPERETMDAEELAELALSISDVGLIEPIILKPVAKRFEAIAGHRRLLACRMVNYSPVPCIIKAVSAVDPLAILVAENAHRENVNPVEEARFYERLLIEVCGNDIDVLCLKVRRRREYVEDRINLVHGYPAVVLALQEKKITLGVARELNKVRQPNQLMLLLDTAIRQGATARQVAEWRKELNVNEDFQISRVDPNSQAINDGSIVPTFVMQCMFCEDGDDPHLMKMVYLHGPCMKIVLKMLGRIPDNSLQGVA